MWLRCQEHERGAMHCYVTKVTSNACSYWLLRIMWSQMRPRGLPGEQTESKGRFVSSWFRLIENSKLKERWKGYVEGKDFLLALLHIADTAGSICPVHSTRSTSAFILTNLLKRGGSRGMVQPLPLASLFVIRLNLMIPLETKKYGRRIRSRRR